MLAALFAATFFALSASCASRSLRHFGPARANLGRLVVATLVLGAFAHTAGGGLGSASTGWFLLSGIIGVTPKDAIAIIRSSAYAAQKPAFTQALQCGPMLVQNGTPVPGLEPTRLARRTAIATGPNHRCALIRLTSTTLADTAKILSLPGIFGTWSTQTALNLDGGSSTGLWAAETVSLPEIKRVRNFLAVFPR